MQRDPDSRYTAPATQITHSALLSVMCFSRVASSSSHSINTDPPVFS